MRALRTFAPALVLSLLSPKASLREGLLRALELELVRDRAEDVGNRRGDHRLRLFRRGHVLPVEGELTCDHIDHAPLRRHLRRRVAGQGGRGGSGKRVVGHGRCLEEAGEALELGEVRAATSRSVAKSTRVTARAAEREG